MDDIINGTLISIHALVKRATLILLRSRYADLISIHALVKRATININAVDSVVRYFNPRPREEGDKKVTKKMVDDLISIHALVKRATFSPRAIEVWILKFQSTPS